MALGAHERLRSQGMTEPRLPPVDGPAPLPDRQGGAAGADRRRGGRRATLARRALEAVLEGLDRRYEELKRERSALDFQDLELRALELLRSSPALAAAWSERFDHVMVDEFQDTNRVQLELVRALRGPQARTLMVGDEHQSIYRFRNADLEVFRAERRAARDSEDSDVLPLRGNFRSKPVGARRRQRHRAHPARRLRRARRRPPRRRARRDRAAADAR